MISQLTRKLSKFVEIFPPLTEELGMLGAFRFLFIRKFSGRHPDLLHFFRPKRLGGQEIAIRPGTTDMGSFQDFLFSRFYLPMWNLPDDPVIIDLGGKIGTAAADFAASYPAARVISVEMDCGNVRQCLRNTSSYRDRVEIVHAAIWHENGSVAYDGISEDGFHVEVASATGNHVEALTMGELLNHYGIQRVAYLKMDIEGAEKEVFGLGDLGWLSRVDSIGWEIHGIDLMDGIAATLTEQGFRVEKDPRHWSSILARRIQSPA